MADFNLTVYINNQEYSQSQLDHIYYTRAIHVLHEMKELGAKITDNNDRGLTNADINYLSMEDANKVLINNKLKLGPEGLKELYQDRINESDKRWKNIIQKSSGNYTKNVSRTHLKVNGISFFKLNEILEEAGSDPQINLSDDAEHFDINNTENGQARIETIGMYGEPTSTDIKTNNVNPPEPVSKTHPKRIIGESRLANDYEIINGYIMHQIRPMFHGMDILLATYFPSATPDEIVKGYSFNLAMEFSNIFKKINQKNKE